jgi:hypothetical protein
MRIICYLDYHEAEFLAFNFRCKTEYASDKSAFEEGLLLKTAVWKHILISYLHRVSVILLRACGDFIQIGQPRQPSVEKGNLLAAPRSGRRRHVLQVQAELTCKRKKEHGYKTGEIRWGHQVTLSILRHSEKNWKFRNVDLFPSSHTKTGRHQLGWVR